MEENKKILLPSKRFKKADTEELDLRLNLETTESLMRIGDRDIILDIDKLYDKERNESKKYKIFGKIKMVFRNMYSGNTDYTYLKDRLYLVGDGTTTDHTGFLPYDEFALLSKGVVTFGIGKLLLLLLSLALFCSMSIISPSSTYVPSFIDLISCINFFIIELFSFSYTWISEANTFSPIPLHSKYISLFPAATEAVKIPADWTK